jgi:hypothetical protein
MKAEGSRRSLRRRVVLVGVAAAAVGLTLLFAVTRDGGASVPRDTTPALQAPTLTNPVVVAVTPENRGLFLDPGLDYIVDLPDTPFTVPGGISIVGGRNVVIRGGEIYDDTPLASGETTDGAYGLYLEDQTGTIHLEGLWIHGRGIGQALILDESKGATVQVQTSRFAALHPVGNDVHTDGIQTWEGPRQLRLRNVTIRTAGVGIQTQPNTFESVAIDRWEYWRVNIVQTTRDAYALWKDAGKGAYWREIHRDFWVKNVGYLAWPSLRHWNPRGPGGVEGEPLSRGLPPRGDFVQARVVGLAYRPPLPIAKGG